MCSAAPQYDEQPVIREDGMPEYVVRSDSEQPFALRRTSETVSLPDASFFLSNSLYYFDTFFFMLWLITTYYAI